MLIRTYPDPVLRQRSQEVPSLTDEDIKLLTDMKETMYALNGIGLAAPQIGILKRIIVVDTGEGLLQMINPEITSRKGATVLEEGCLSVPETSVEVKRPEEISVSFTDKSGSRQKNNFSGLTAKAIQHEIDHLNGKLIVDYMPWYKKILPRKGRSTCLLS